MSAVSSIPHLSKTYAISLILVYSIELRGATKAPESWDQNSCFLLQCMSLLLAQSGHGNPAQQCPLLGVKRTLLGHCGMSAFDPKRTFDPDVALLLRTRRERPGGR